MCFVFTTRFPLCNIILHLV
uniref:Uncharacterized protein n=1 Tax=Anguilla anguilla TaxID=7936 RepID=A0A0E9PVR3_ANGAN